MAFSHSRVAKPGIADARPLGDEWTFLFRGGRLEGPVSGRLDLGDLREPLELHLSADSRFATVVERQNRFGRVFDLRTGGLAMALDRGINHPTVSIFPVAFFVHEGRPLLIHGSDWNRLEISDPATGECLSSRGSLPDEEMLDFFHGGLSVSPDGSFVADDGWLWHPMGLTRVWSIPAWMKNPWESENGPTVRSVCYRGVYRWDGPLCWIDGSTLAVWGSEGGELPEYSEEAEVAFFRFFDATTGQEIRRFEVPSRLPEAGAWMAFDRFLFTVQPSEGTGVWDLSGELVALEAGFVARRYHPRRGEFLSWDEEGAVFGRFGE